MSSSFYIILSFCQMQQSIDVIKLTFCLICFLFLWLILWPNHVREEMFISSSFHATVQLWGTSCRQRVAGTINHNPRLALTDTARISQIKPFPNWGSLFPEDSNCVKLTIKMNQHNWFLANLIHKHINVKLEFFIIFFCQDLRLI